MPQAIEINNSKMKTQYLQIGQSESQKPSTSSISSSIHAHRGFSLAWYSRHPAWHGDTYDNPLALLHIGSNNFVEQSHCSLHGWSIDRKFSSNTLLPSNISSLNSSWILTPTIEGFEHGSKSIVGTNIRTISTPPIAETLKAENNLDSCSKLANKNLHFDTVQWYFPVPYKPTKAPVSPPIIMTAYIGFHD